jgi:alpha-tubulin suppressor-like RCC1 family protein
MGDNLMSADLGAGKTATAIVAGSNHTCALLSDGTVKCWGKNDYGQLGLGDVQSRGDATNEMGDNLASVDLGFGNSATAIATGAVHTCALLKNGAVKCWGRNDGQLGLGDTQKRGDNANEMGDALPIVKLFSNLW